MTIVGMLQSIAGAGFMALAVPFADRILHIGTSGWRFGLLFSVWGIGGIAAAGLTPRLLRNHSTGWVTLAFIPVSGIAGVAIVLTSNWIVASVLMAIWGLAYQGVIINATSYRQQVTPERLLGRVNTAGRMLSYGVGWTLGSVIAGVLAARLGVRPAMIVMVGVGLVAAAYAWISPLRRLADSSAETYGAVA